MDQLAGLWGKNELWEAEPQVTLKNSSGTDHTAVYSSR